MNERGGYMDAITNYLEGVFGRFPATPEYDAVKQELLQRMQQRYTVLIESGRSENEAVGTVIAECGNAEELLAQRGLLTKSREVPGQELMYLSADEAKKYYAERKSKGVLIGVGVLFVLMGAGLMTGIEGVREYFRLSEKVDIVAAVAFFMMVLPAVFMFVYSGMSGGMYSFIDKGNFYLDQETKMQIEYLRQNLKANRAGCVAIGVGACILGVIAVLIGELLGGDIGAEFGACVMLHLVGIGVLLFVYSAYRNGALEKLLKDKDED